MPNTTLNEETLRNIDRLAAEFAKQFVRKDNKFFDVNYLSNALSRSNDL